MNFRDAAIRSSELYYDYLRMNKGSLIKYSVERVSKYDPYYRLYTNAPLSDVDMMQIKISSNIFSREEYQIVETNRKEKYLRIIPDRTLEKYLSSSETNDIELIIDLKFLVKNVGSFIKGMVIVLVFLQVQIIYPMLKTANLKISPPKNNQKL